MSAILTMVYLNLIQFAYVQTEVFLCPNSNLEHLILNWRLEQKKINYHRFDEMLSSKRQKSAFIEMLAFETKQLLTHIIAKG